MSDRINRIAMRALVEASRPPAQEPGRHLYAVAGLWTRRVKIGRATDVRQRMRVLQANSGEELVPIAWAENLGDLEGRVHGRFGAERVHHEWFSSTLTEELTRVVPVQFDAPSAEFETWVRGVTTDQYAQPDPRTGVRLAKQNTFLWRGKTRIGT